MIDPRTLRPLDLDTILDSVQEDQPRGDRRGGLAARRRGRQPGRADPGAGLRLPRRARAARDRRRRADALLQAARAGRVPARGARRAGGPGHVQGSLRWPPTSTMPRLSDSMEEGTVLKWLVEEGGEVKRGEPLVEIETDKANMTYEADADGVLIEVWPQEGDTLPIGEVIARDRRGRRGDAGDGQRSRGGGAGAGARGRGGRRPRRRRPRRPPSARAARPSARRRATAAAACEGLAGRPAHGARAGRRAGSVWRARAGRADREGRRRGCRRAAAAQAGGRPRRRAAEAARGARARSRARGEAGAKGEVRVHELTASSRRSPGGWPSRRPPPPTSRSSSTVDMTRAVELRERLKEVADPAPSYNDMVVKACRDRAARVPARERRLPRRAVRALLARERRRGGGRPGRAGGADRVRRRPEVARRDRRARRARWSSKVRDGTITPPELSGGTFTVSNLGMYGIEQLHARSSTRRRPRSSRSGALQAEAVVDERAAWWRATMMGVTLVCDHRILYGADGARVPRPHPRAARAAAVAGALGRGTAMADGHDRRGAPTAARARHARRGDHRRRAGAGGLPRSATTERDRADRRGAADGLRRARARRRRGRPSSGPRAPRPDDPEYEPARAHARHARRGRLGDHHRRRPGDHGGGQPRRARRRRAARSA